jgi:nucleotide-binding universal stress UspA family protein
MFKNVLVPHDGSALSKKGVRQAVALARAVGARVTGFHVAPDYATMFLAPSLLTKSDIPEHMISRRETSALRILREIEKICEKEEVSFSGFFALNENPAAAILEATSTYKADAIAMASHSRKGISSLLLGSQTQKVLALSSVPVMVFRG